jgi:hypothetical protein
MKNTLLHPLFRNVLHALALLLISSMGETSFAADHRDGPAVQKDASEDITDFFIFPRLDENKQKRLSLILSTYPYAKPDTLFNNALNYRFRFRPVTGFQSQKPPFKAIVSDEEFRIDCRAKSRKVPQELTCELVHVKGKGQNPTVLDKVTVKTQELSGGTNPAFKVFAGLRADQLFTDRARVRMPVWRDTDLSSGTDWPGVNSFDGKNVLSIVVDLSVDKYLKNLDNSYLAAVSEVAEIDSSVAGGLRQIDRMGRVEVTVFIVREPGVQDLWNADDTFSLNPQNVDKYRAELQKGLRRMDGFELIDGDLDNRNVYDWPNPHPWVDLLMEDFLIVGLNRPTSPSSKEVGYLGIEIAHFTGVPAGAVGGRLPNEDVIQRTLTLFINGLNRPTPNRGVGVPNPARETVDAFPFVPPPFQPAPSTPGAGAGR